MLAESNTRVVVESELRALLQEDDDAVTDWKLDFQLHDLGLNSLSLARLIVQLETRLEVDPFSDGESIADMRSVEDLVRVYDRALSGSR